MGEGGETEGPDEADRALADLTRELATCVASLQVALERAEQLRSARARGSTWHQAVSGEERPLIVERISDALDSLGGAGSRWRREEARALRADGMSISAVAALFGVTRQRASVLVREPGMPAGGDDGPHGVRTSQAEVRAPGGRTSRRADRR